MHYCAINLASNRSTNNIVWFLELEVIINNIAHCFNLPVTFDYAVHCEDSCTLASQRTLNCCVELDGEYTKNVPHIFKI